jgi:hypothetical protein
LLPAVSCASWCDSDGATDVKNCNEPCAGCLRCQSSWGGREALDP